MTHRNHMEKRLRVLIVEDSEDDALLLERELRRGDWQLHCRRVDSAAGMQKLLAEETWDVVLADYRLPRFSGLKALEMVKETGIDIPFVIVSGTIGEETAVAAMKAGAHDYLMKGNLARLVPAVARELREAEERRQRRRAEQRLHENEEQLRTIIDSMAQALVVTDRRDRLVMINRAAEELLGVASTTVLNRPLEAAIRDRTLLKLLQAGLAQKEQSVEFDFELPGGAAARPRLMRARTAAIRNRSEGASGVVTVFLDLTRERELDRMKTEFISTAAHELRTPLTSIRGFSELLLGEKLDSDEQRKFLRRILEQAEALSRIVGDLLDISRIESGQPLPLSKAPCDIGELTREVVDCFRVRSPLHRFEVTLKEAPATLPADAGKIREVLANILANAVTYSPRGGPIRVSGERRDGSYRIAVEDRGIGMSPDQVERIFDKFYRVDASTTAAGGLGLGMSIVKHIVETHGGRIRVESELGRGTVVRFTLPLNAEEKGDAGEKMPS